MHISNFLIVFSVELCITRHSLQYEKESLLSSFDIEFAIDRRAITKKLFYIKTLLHLNWNRIECEIWEKMQFTLIFSLDRAKLQQVTRECSRVNANRKIEGKISFQYLSKVLNTFLSSFCTTSVVLTFGVWNWACGDFEVKFYCKFHFFEGFKKSRNFLRCQIFCRIF
jgi:hypothetical protein